MTKPDHTTRHQPKPNPERITAEQIAPRDLEQAILRAVGLNPFDVYAFTLRARVNQPTTLTVELMPANARTLEHITTRYTLTEETP